MSLARVSIRDVSGFVSSIQASSAHLGAEESPWDMGRPTTKFYHDQTDQLYCDSAATNVWCRLDPLLSNTGFGPGQLNETYVVDSGLSRFGVGEWNKDTGLQRIFGYDLGVAARPYQEVNISDLLIASPDFASDWDNGNLVFQRNSGGSSTADGYRSNDTTHVDGFVVFESARGPTGTEYPEGYIIQSGAQVREGASGPIYDRTISIIGLERDGGLLGGFGRATILPMVGWYDESQSPLHPTTHGPPFAGFDVALHGMQFAPDDDSTPIAPKGRLFFFSDRGEIFQNHRIPDQELGGVGTTYFKFVDVYEWNDTQKDPTPGNVNRVHLRRILHSNFGFVENLAITPGTNNIGERNGAGLTDLSLVTAFFHPPTNTIRYSLDLAPAVSPDGPYTEVVASLSAELDGLSVPTAVGQPETGKTVRFQSIARGSLGELISGLDVDWTLDRRSSVDEILVGTVPAATVFVANFPIDGESATDNSLVVKKAGVPLVEGVDYTVVLNTGAITGIGGEFIDGPVYTASYEHSTNGANPPHGILRTDTSKTDANGIAVALVEAADDDAIVGEFDGLESVEAP